MLYIVRVSTLNVVTSSVFHFGYVKATQISNQPYSLFPGINRLFLNQHQFTGIFPSRFCFSFEITTFLYDVPWPVTCSFIRWSGLCVP